MVRNSDVDATITICHPPFRARAIVRDPARTCAIPGYFDSLQPQTDPMADLIYSTTYLSQLPEASFHRLLDAVPSPTREKILRYHRWEDAHATLLGRHLLRLALREISPTTAITSLEFTSTGKPFFPSGPHFNISHSGTRVALAISTAGRIGIDIEQIIPISFVDFQNQFTPGEWAAIRASPMPLNEFYRFRTAKESLIKADGRGLGIPLQQLDVSQGHPVHFDGTAWYLRPLIAFHGYAAHVCAENAATETIARQLTLKEIVDSSA